MIDRNSFGWELSCDHCSTQEQYDDDEVGNWSGFMEALKKDGWLCEPVDGDWDHSCPSCAEERGTQDGGGMTDSWG